MKGELLADVPADLPEELIEPILRRRDLRIERIVSLGHASPADFWYDQAEHEFVVLLQGAARLQFEDETVELTPGSFVDIPARRRHRVAWTDPNQPTIWLAIHYGG